MKMASPKSLPFSPAVCGHWAPSVFRHLNSALTPLFFCHEKIAQNSRFKFELPLDGFEPSKLNFEPLPRKN